MSKLMMSVLCVAVAASPAVAEPSASAIAGRWQGPDYRMAAVAPDCDGDACTITLDIAPCGEGWCGVEVAADNSCGGTALTLGAGKVETSHVLFEGKLELAKGTEPYVVQAYLVEAAGEVAEELEIIGDTGGEFRAFRRSFPFHSNLARMGAAVCRSDKPVS